MTSTLSVLQIPEVCAWNPYVAAGASALTAHGVRVLSPGICHDLLVPKRRTFRTDDLASVRPSVVHLHWPEKLAQQFGTDGAIRLLSFLAGQGARLVQTIHNVAPHEPSPDLERFQRFVDERTDGIHVFSAAHETAVREHRRLPDAVLHLAHPQYPLPQQAWPKPKPRTAACLGRLRSYKRADRFARGFLDLAGPDAQLVVAGEPSDTRIDGAIRALTGDDQRLTYIPGFLNEQAFWEVLANVEWVVLPYEQIVSSGVLVAALQMSRRILSPTPIGGLPLYGHASGSPDWVTVDPWDDETAIARWLTAADLQRPGSPTTLNLPTWDAAAETMTAFYRELVSSRPENERRSHSAGPPSPNPTPVFAPLTAGDPFDFGTHSNDFLLRREQALATETFLVRVPGLGAVPEHVHTDMEQTFVFVSGVGEATLSRDDGPVIRRTCVPGDMVFVPTGWRHSVTALTLEGVAYVTVNAFVPGADRIGDSAVSHASIALTGFEASRPPAPSPSDAPETASALALFRTAETAFLADDDLQRARAQDFTALQATLTREPSTYRVRRTGPFEYVRTVTARPRVLTAALADVLFGAVAGRAPVYVEGSQSPISAKLPCSESDVDVLLAVDSAEQLIAAHEALNALKRVAGRLPAPLSPGVVHIDWLRLPNFYTALSLDPASPDRRWWDATESERLEEADRRLRRSLTQLDDVAELRDLLGRSLALAGLTDVAVDEWRLIPRWRGYV